MKEIVVKIGPGLTGPNEKELAPFVAAFGRQDPDDLEGQERELNEIMRATKFGAALFIQPSQKPGVTEMEIRKTPRVDFINE